MPQRADAGPSINVEIDVDQKYIVEVLGITESQAQWDNAKEGDMSLTWRFHVYDQQGAAVIDNNGGDQYELWNFTGDKTYRSKSGKAAKAREWTEALVGRELTDDEMNELIDLGFEDSLKKKRGLADLEWYTTKGGNERLRIIRLRPYKKGKVVAADEPADTTALQAQIGEAIAATAPAAKQERSPSEIAARRKALGLDDAA